MFITVDFKTFAKLFEFLVDRSQYGQFTLVMDEFQESGRDYTTYFPILSLIASSSTSSGEIESNLFRFIYKYRSAIEIGNDLRHIGSGSFARNLYL